MKITLRAFWHKPKPHVPGGNRKVTWLELFYDLIYVVVIAELAHELAYKANLQGLITFVFLFLPVWFSWLSSLYYITSYETNDMSLRVFMGLQMFAVGGMAVFAHDAAGEGSAGFLLSYAAHHFIIVVINLRAYMHMDKDSQAPRPAYLTYCLAYLFTTLLYVASVFIPIPLRFAVVGVGLFIDFITPIVFSIIASQITNRKFVTSEKFTERFGLMTIIVLGESVAGIIAGIAGMSEQGGTNPGLVLLFGTIAFWFWWQYFDTVAARKVRDGIWYFQWWNYMHMVLFISLTIFGASMLIILKEMAHDGQVHSMPFLLISFAMAIFSIALMEPAFQEHPAPWIRPDQIRRISLIKLGTGFTALPLLLLRTDAITTLVLLLLIQLACHFYPWYIWASAKQREIDAASREGS